MGPVRLRAVGVDGCAVAGTRARWMRSPMRMARAGAGHPGERDTGNWILLAMAAKQLQIPFVASGGCADGNQLAAALAIGAEGLNMGTRFMATVEAPIHANIKQALVDGDVRAPSRWCPPRSGYTCGRFTRFVSFRHACLCV
jgi:hypothetical protein